MIAYASEAKILISPQPPAVCRTHTERVAHFVCANTKRPLCEECIEEKRFGGTSVLVCRHCGGTAAELPIALEEM